MNDPARLSALAQEVAADPGSDRYPELAASLLSLGRYVEAAEVCERGIALAPSPIARSLLAEARLLLGQREAAEAAARAALDGSPNDPRALRVLGAIHLDHGRIAEARTALERSAALDPSDMQTLDLLARIPEEATVVASEAPWASPASAAPDPGGDDGGGPWVPPTLPAHPPPDPGALPDFELEPATKPADGEPFALDPPPAAGGSDPSPYAFEPPPAEGLSGDAPFALDDPQPPGADGPTPFAMAQGPAPGGAPAAFELDLPAPEETAPPAPAAPPMEAEEPLELDLPDPKPAAPEPPASPAPTRRTTGSGAPRPPSRPTPAPAFRPAPKRPLDPRLVRFGIGGTAILVVVVLAGAGLSSMQKNRRQAAYDEAMAAARSAMTRDLPSGYGEASDHLAEAIRQLPQDPAALGLAAFAQARLYTAFGGATDALVAAEDHLAVAEPLPTLAPEAAAARGLLHLAAGRLAEAVSTVTRSLVDHPDHPMLLWVRAQGEVRLEREDMAIESLRRARRADPAFLPAATTLADLLADEGEPEEAARIRLGVLASHPWHVPTLTGLLESARAGHAEPEAVLERVLETRQTWPETVSPSELCRLHLGTAQVAVLAGRPALATESEDLAAIAETSAECRAALARQLDRRHRPAPALSAWERALEGDPAMRVPAARAALVAGRPARVLEILPEGTSDPTEQALRARALLREGRVPDARQAAERATAEPRRATVEAWAALSAVLRAAGDAAGARRAALRCRGADGDAHEVLSAAEALRSAGDVRSALAVLDAASRPVDEADYAVLVAAGQALGAARRVPAALHRLEAAIRLNPEAEPAVILYLDLAPGDRAQRFFSDLASPWGPVLEGLARFGAGDRAEAAARLEAAGDPATSAWIRHLDALLHHATGPIDLGELRTRVAAAPDRILPRVVLADALLALGRLDEAQETVREGLSRTPEDPRLEGRLAEAMALAGASPPSALRTARDAAGRLSATRVDAATEARILAAWSLACAATADTRCARRQMAAARRTAPADGRVLFMAGRTLESLGDRRGAESAYREAADRPGGEEALFRLGEGRAGAAAHDDLRTFLERSPGHALAGRARDRLARGD